MVYLTINVEQIPFRFFYPRFVCYPRRCFNICTAFVFKEVNNPIECCVIYEYKNKCIFKYFTEEDISANKFHYLNLN